MLKRIVRLILNIMIILTSLSTAILYCIINTFELKVTITKIFITLKVLECLNKFKIFDTFIFINHLLLFMLLHTQEHFFYCMQARHNVGKNENWII